MHRVTTPTARQGIILPTDFSATARRAYPFAAALARQYGAQLFLVHFGRKHAPAYSGISRHDHLSNLSSALAEETQCDDFAGMDVRPRLLVSHHISELMCNYQREMRCDLVVMATSARKGLARLISIDCPAKMIAQSTVPVLLYGPAVTANSISSPARVLVAPVWAERAMVTQRVNQWASVKVAAESFQGTTASEIVDCAHAMRADAIAIDVNGSLSTFARQVIRQAKCGVLCLPAARRSESLPAAVRLRAVKQFVGKGGRLR